MAVGLLPVLGGAVGGRWGLPSQGIEQPLAFLARPSTGVARVLWLGDPRALPSGGWSVEPGLAYALTPEELPDATQVFAPAGPGPADEVAKAVRLAAAGGTVHLGRLLAPAGVRYVVVVDALAPSLVGSSPASVERATTGRPQRRPPRAGRPPGGAGRARRPGLRERGEHAGHRHARHRTAGARVGLPGRGGRRGLAAGVEPAVVGWAGHRSGAGGHPLRRLCPGGELHLDGGRAHSGRQPAFGWAAQYAVSAKGGATLSLSQFPFVPLVVLLELAAWVLLALALIGRRRGPLAPATVTPALPGVTESAVLIETVTF